MTDRNSIATLHLATLHLLQSVHDQAKVILQEWANNQGHDRCHWHPEILQELASLFDVHPTVEPRLPARAEFREFCRRYENEQYGEEQ